MFDKYCVRSGETLESIAKKFKTNDKYLQDINNLYFDDELRAGMELVVPNSSKAYFDFYTIESGDNLYAISRKYNINPNLLASLNGLNQDEYIYPGQQLLIPKSNYSYYITAEGDTLNSVINAFGSNKNKFLDENETIYLMAGQLLVNRKN